jgi:hypothetical protein
MKNIFNQVIDIPELNTSLNNIEKELDSIHTMFDDGAISEDEFAEVIESLSFCVDTIMDSLEGESSDDIFDVEFDVETAKETRKILTESFTSMLDVLNTETDDNMALNKVEKIGTEMFMKLPGVLRCIPAESPRL